MIRQKLSVTVARSLAEFIDSYQHDNSLPTRSEVVERALRLLREQHLESQYAAAGREFDALWDNASADGLDPDGWQ